ncbi:hypothetical protein QYM36_007715 [Artemia franciscana]|uniref:Uncharacterized protein n=1 Tax=Artemia franciscana TaxID=6661 RepID=A0AA88ICZ3_ARTSF|nr:hypothetical protein QYM36_007715 [Artemia franciscana]
MTIRQDFAATFAPFFDKSQSFAISSGLEMNHPGTSSGRKSHLDNPDLLTDYKLFYIEQSPFPQQYMEQSKDGRYYCFADVNFVIATHVNVYDRPERSLAVVAENMESWYFPPLKVPSDLSSNKSDSVIVLKNFPPVCDCSLNGKIALDTFAKEGAIHKVVPSKDKLGVYQRTTEAA